MILELENMKRVFGIIISVVIIGLGLSGQFVLKGTNSSTALVIAGVLFLVIEIIGAIRDNKRDDHEESLRAEVTDDAQMNSELKKTDTRHQALMINENDGEHDSPIIRLTDNNYYETIADNSNVVVCFCDLVNGTSKLLLPLLHEFALDYKGNIVVGLYDVYAEGCEQVRADNDITAIPTLLFYKDGMEIRKSIGVVKKDMLKTLFDELLI